MITKPFRKKLKVSDSGKCKVLVYVDYSLITEFKDYCKKKGVSMSNKFEHLMIAELAKEFQE
jgi:hypothetical protein